MRSRIQAFGYLIVPVFLLLLLAQQAESGMLRTSLGDGGAHVDLVVRKVMVTPVRAHVGDSITIEMTWEYWGDLVNDYYDTTFAEVLANGKVVARKPFVYSFGANLGEVYRETLLWDTKGMTPGKYRIRGEVPLRLDATPYDNFLDVKELLVLLPAGEPFPAGEESGKSAVAENLFWRNR
jgi:hypothetical protein